VTWYHHPGARDRRRAALPPPDVVAFHRALPGYAPTPLTEVPALAAELGVARVLVKDESSRLALPAFKVLGASWAVARLLAAPGAPRDLEALRAAAARRPVTLVTATDGNHGRAVARMAALVGAAARVVVPDVVPARAGELIAAEGAVVTTVEGSYEDAVAEAARIAAADSTDSAAELVQDTAWPGYETVPGWVVEGYATLVAEVDERLGRAPDLVVVPVGVGSLAQAVVTHYRPGPAGTAPAVVAAEPERAAGLLASLRAGRPVTAATGTTVMAGLNCGTVSTLAWPVLRDGLDAAVAVGEDDALRAVADLGSHGVSSGPSGAATLAAARRALTGAGSQERRAALGVTPESVVVLLSTEGASPTTGAPGPRPRSGA